MIIYKLRKRCRYKECEDFPIIQKRSFSYNCESYAVWDRTDKWIWSTCELDTICKRAKLSVIDFKQAKMDNIIIFIDYKGDVRHYAKLVKKSIPVWNSEIVSKWGSNHLVQSSIDGCATYGLNYVFARKLDKV